MLIRDGEFLFEFLNSCLPGIRIGGRFNVNNLLPLEIERQNINFTFIASLATFSNLYIAPDKITLILIPFSYKLFQKVHLCFFPPGAKLGK